MSSYPSIVDMRLQQLKFAMDEFKLQAAYISYLPNVKYLTNFSGSHAELIVHDDTVHFFTDSRYEQQVATELYPLPGLQIHITDDIWGYCKKNHIFNEFNILGFEADKIPYSVTIDIRNHVRPLKFKPSPYLFEPFTQPKGDEELAHIKKAAAIAEETYLTVLEKVKTRMSEEELALEIIYTARKLGSQDSGEAVFVTSGLRGNIIHGKPTDKNLRKNELVMVNFTTVHNGFCCELARTFCIGKATKQQQRAYEKIIEAQQLAIDTLVPGMTGQYLDNVVRKFMKKEKLEKYFPHALGYGIGIKTHEHPYIEPQAVGEMVPDKTVIAIAPGVYTPRFGMRVQDLVQVSVNGCKRITQPPLTLPVIEG